MTATRSWPTRRSPTCRWQRLIDPAYLAGLRGLIDPERALPDLPRAGEAVLPPHRDTVYLCVVDQDGNACSFINSLFKSFGSGILAERSGVMLQNRGAGFVVQRGHPNCIAPGKRPMHTIIPGMLTKDGEAVMPFGVMGGHFQPMGQTLVPRQPAGIRPGHPARARPAAGVPVWRQAGGGARRAAATSMLARLGHGPAAIERPHGGGQAIWIDRARGTLVGGSDPRKDGIALGY